MAILKTNKEIDKNSGIYLQNPISKKHSCKYTLGKINRK